jgi:hypothetical protein
MTGERFALESLTEAAAGAVTGKIVVRERRESNRGDVGGAALNVVFNLTGATLPRPLRGRRGLTAVIALTASSR